MKKLLKVKVLLNFGLLLIATLPLLMTACSKKNSGAAEIPPTIVGAVPVKTQLWGDEIKATGTLSAHQGVILKSEVAGRVDAIYFDSGQNVKAGANLIQFNSNIIKSELEYNKAQLVLARNNEARTQELFKKHVVTKANLDTAIANFESAKAQVAKSQAQLDQTLIRAPFEGRVGIRLVKIGDYVQPGREIVSLQNYDPMHIDFTVPEIYAGKIAVGNTVSLMQNATTPNETITTGKIQAIDSAIDRTTRSIKVRAEVKNPDYKLIPGGFVEVTVAIGQKTPVLTIPQVAIVYDASGNYVYKIVDKKASKTMVKLGQRINDDIIVTKGLTTQDIVITSGQQKLGDGVPVMVEPKKSNTLSTKK